MKHRVCTVTGSRAEFGLLAPLIGKIESDEKIEHRLVVTGSHLSDAFGSTVNEIEESGIPIHAKIELPIKGDGKCDTAKATGTAISLFAEYFDKNRPALVIVLGDRFEIFAAATAAAILGIPIAHLYGGETTEGAIDEFFRHSITKMSVLHFVSCETYRRRVIQLGEAPERVFNVGALGIENIFNLPMMTVEELGQSLNSDLTSCRFCVVTFHSVTLEEGTEEEQIRELIAALNEFPEMKFIITKANADAGGRIINRIWTSETPKHSNWVLVSSLGSKRYLSALKNAEMMIGNSSSGIIEGPSAHIPTINIGNRQKARVRADSIIDCKPVKEEIAAAMKKAMTAEFKAIARNTASPFGDGNVSSKIYSAITDYLKTGSRGIEKSFYDIEFETEKL